MDKKDIIAAFVKKHSLAVISTVSVDIKPESALVDIVLADKLDIIFSTPILSRKARNISRNPNVSLVIGLSGHITVQYEGKAHELEGRQLEKVKNLHGKKLIYIRKWKIKDLRFYKILPELIQYCDYRDFPPKIFQVKF